MRIKRRYFYLLAAYFYAFNRGTEKNAAIAIGFLFELQRENKIFIPLFGRKVAVLFIRTTFANKLFAAIDIPFFSAIYSPARKVFTIKNRHGFLRKNYLSGNNKNNSQKYFFHFSKIYCRN